VIGLTDGKKETRRKRASGAGRARLLSGGVEPGWASSEELVGVIALAPRPPVGINTRSYQPVRMERRRQLAQIPATGPSCAERLAVLADPTRLAVLESLLEGPKHVKDINRRLRVPQSLLSHHLRVLREAALVVAVRDGKAVLYAIAPGARPRGAGASIDLGCCNVSFPRGHLGARSR
jgi:DNA-binding transcriptional ArsR family regulator